MLWEAKPNFWKRTLHPMRKVTPIGGRAVGQRCRCWWAGGRFQRAAQLPGRHRHRLSAPTLQQRSPEVQLQVFLHPAPDLPSKGLPEPAESDLESLPKPVLQVLQKMLELFCAEVSSHRGVGSFRGRFCRLDQYKNLHPRPFYTNKVTSPPSNPKRDHQGLPW